MPKVQVKSNYFCCLLAKLLTYILTSWIEEQRYFTNGFKGKEKNLLSSYSSWMPPNDGKSIVAALLTSPFGLSQLACLKILPRRIIQIHKSVLQPPPKLHTNNSAFSLVTGTLKSKILHSKVNSISEAIKLFAEFL